MKPLIWFGGIHLKLGSLSHQYCRNGLHCQEAIKVQYLLFYEESQKSNSNDTFHNECDQNLTPPLLWKEDISAFKLNILMLATLAAAEFDLKDNLIHFLTVKVYEILPKWKRRYHCTNGWFFYLFGVNGCAMVKIPVQLGALNMESQQWWLIWWTEELFHCRVPHG